VERDSPSRHRLFPRCSAFEFTADWDDKRMRSFESHFSLLFVLKFFVSPPLDQGLLQERGEVREESLVVSVSDPHVPYQQIGNAARVCLLFWCRSLLLPK